MIVLLHLHLVIFKIHISPLVLWSRLIGIKMFWVFFPRPSIIMFGIIIVGFPVVGGAIADCLILLEI